jgi:hypothetical protein
MQSLSVTTCCSSAITGVAAMTNNNKDIKMLNEVL